MQQIDVMFRTMIVELGQRAFDDAWAEDFPPTGRFVSVTVDSPKAWYFDQPDGAGGRKRRYVGPADDAEIPARVDSSGTRKQLNPSFEPIRTLSVKGPSA